MVITAYLEIVEEMPQVFIEITKAYNDEGSGYAVSPYCIIHQTFRRIIGSKIKIKGSQCEILQLGCKARNGNIKQRPENIRQSGLTEAAVTTLKWPELQTIAWSFMSWKCSFRMTEMSPVTVTKMSPICRRFSHVHDPVAVHCCFECLARVDLDDDDVGAHALCPGTRHLCRTSRSRLRLRSCPRAARSWR